LIERRNDHCAVEYFDSPTVPPLRVEMQIADVERATVPEQTRAYHYNVAIGAWEIGRLLDDHGDQQLVQFPNG
jgi:ATP-dependent helicase HepA